ncbi:unnamed protein product [Soboliphyme baturini]|uniref:Beta-1,4-N-acetylgalactosaminyltransferase n=1 Tax=Soboliphyme baturini TaxID=241478 RepID=A0A183J4B3_9BILA|nr:unnamed protein product [Soboliphyme baturini]
MGFRAEYGIKKLTFFFAAAFTLLVVCHFAFRLTPNDPEIPVVWEEYRKNDAKNYPGHNPGNGSSLKEETTSLAIEVSSNSQEKGTRHEVSFESPSFNDLNIMFGNVSFIKGSRESSTAIIIPYRNRENHLRTFLFNLVPFLEKQNCSYAFYVVEQVIVFCKCAAMRHYRFPFPVPKQIFNKGKLMNVGYLFAKALRHHSCYIFHDVDLLPEDIRNVYACDQNPRHLAVAVDTLNYRLIYNQLMGGVTVFTDTQFQAVNGFANYYWGWGAEDEDIYYRVLYANYTVQRDPEKISRYKMIRHHSHPLFKANPCRLRLLSQVQKLWKLDGLNNLVYKLIEIEETRFYTKLMVDALPDLSFERGC